MWNKNRQNILTQQETHPCQHDAWYNWSTQVLLETNKCNTKITKGCKLVRRSVYYNRCRNCLYCHNTRVRVATNSRSRTSSTSSSSTNWCISSCHWMGWSSPGCSASAGVGCGLLCELGLCLLLLVLCLGRSSLRYSSSVQVSGAFETPHCWLAHQESGVMPLNCSLSQSNWRDSGCLLHLLSYLGVLLHQAVIMNSHFHCFHFL